MTSLQKLLQSYSRKTKVPRILAYKSKYNISYWERLQTETEYTNEYAILGQKWMYDKVNPKTALSYFTECNIVEYHNTILAQEMARCYRDIGNLNKAMEYYDMHLQFHPKDYENLYHLSALYNETDGMEKGDGLWTTALSNDANNDNAKMYYSLWLIMQCESYQNALDILHTVVDNQYVEPKARPYWMIGWIYTKLGQHTLAHEFYSTALEKFGDDNVKVYAAKCMDAYQTENWSMAVEINLNLIQHYDIKKCTDTLFIKCETYMDIAKLCATKLDDMEKMKQYIQYAVESVPHYDFSKYIEAFKSCFNQNNGKFWNDPSKLDGFVSYLFYGIYLLESNDATKQSDSIIYFNKAICANDASCIAHSYRGDALMNNNTTYNVSDEKYYEMAKISYETAIKLAPQYENPWINLICLLCCEQKEGHRENIINLCNNALEYHPNNSVIYGFKAIQTYFMEIGDFGYETARSNFIENMMKYVKISRMYNDFGKRWMKTNDDIEAFINFGIGMYHLHTEKTKTALNHFIHILEKGKFQLVAEETIFANIIDCYTRLNQIKKLKLYNNLAISKFPNSAWINMQTGLYLINFENQVDKGVEYLNKAVELAKDDKYDQDIIAISLTTAKVYVYMKQYDDAMRHYQTVLNLRPNEKDYYHQKAKQGMQESMKHKPMKKAFI